MSEYELNEKINEKLYSDLNKQKTIESIIKVCQKENENNERKIRVHKQQNFIKNLKKSLIKKLTNKEKKLNIVLDNYRVHHAKIVEFACEILNIKLIYLPPYSPDLNPIEDVWRLIKRETYNYYFDDFKQLIKKFETKFYEKVDQKSLYENWIETYIN
ncbi:MAG: transposase [Methanobrevibacter sp.]|nr:transposase [Methanobrevibacter sp.]